MAFDLRHVSSPLLEGRFETLEIPSLLLAAVRQRRSGALFLRTGKITRRVSFSDGWPIAADSNLPEEMLRSFIVASGVLTEAKIRQAEARSKETGIGLTEAAISLGMLSKSDTIAAAVALRSHVIKGALASASVDASFDVHKLSGFSILPIFQCVEDVAARYPVAIVEPLLTASANERLLLQSSETEIAQVLGGSRAFLHFLEEASKSTSTLRELMTDPKNPPHLVLTAILTGLLSIDSAREAPFSGNEIAGALSSLDETELLSEAELVPESREPEVVVIARPTKRGVPIALSLVVLALVGAGAYFFLRTPEPPPAPPAPIVAAAPVFVPPPASLPASQPPPKPPPPPKPVVISAAHQQEIKEAVIAFRRGTAFLKKKKYKLAVKDYENAVLLAPEEGKYHRALAIAYTKLSDLPRATREYRLYLITMPNAPDAAQVRALIEEPEQ